MTELSYLLCAFQHGNISSGDSIGTGCGDAGRFGILDSICTKERKDKVSFHEGKVTPLCLPLTPVMSELCELAWLNSYQGCDLCKSSAPYALVLPFTAGRGLPKIHKEREKETFSALDTTNVHLPWRVMYYYVEVITVFRGWEKVLAKAENGVAMLCSGGED